MVTERTNASTTGLLDVRTGEWDTDLMSRVGLRSSLFTDLVDPGATIGKVTDEVGEQIGVPGLTVTAVGSHDTASAVVGVPMQTDDAAYISCGTWGLVGLELDAPVLTDEARKANFTNEGGVDGRTRFLTNVMGTWLISETLREWERSGVNVSLPDILAAAAGVTTDVPVFDVQDARFLPPGDMPGRIAELCAERGVRAPASKAELMRSIVESLAYAFGSALDTAERLAARRSGSCTSWAAARSIACCARRSPTAAVVPSSPARSRPPRSATSSSRVARSARSRARWRTCGVSSRVPTTFSATNHVHDRGHVSIPMAGSRGAASRLAALSSVAAQPRCASLLCLASRARMPRSLIGHQLRGGMPA